MAIKEKKESWFQKRTRLRAEAECAVVDACVIQADSKSKESQVIISELERLVETIRSEVKQRFAAKDDIGELTIRKEEALQYELEVKEERHFKESYMRLVQMLRDVQMMINRLMRMGDYKTVIRIIPEKTLPKYIKALDKETLEKVLEKTDAIRKKLQDRMLEITKAGKARAEAKARSAFVSDFVAEKANGTEAKQRADLEAFIAGGKTATEPVVPVPAEVETSQTETAPAVRPTNKA